MQLPPAPPGREGQGGRARGGRHADGVQHGRHLRRHHDGDRGHEDLADQPRGDRRLDRAGGARPHVRRRGGPLRLRQDHPRLRDGAGPARRAEPHALRRLDRARALARQGRDDPGRVRGDRRPRRRRPHRRRAHRPREPRLARAPAPAAASSPPTPWRWPSRCSASRRWAARWCRRRTARRARSPRSAAGSCSRCSSRTAAPARSSPSARSRTRSRRARCPAARPTSSSTCWRWRTRPGSSSSWRTSTGSPGRRPLLCDLKPGGRYVATDLYRAGGVPLVIKRLKELGALHEDALTVTGQTIGEVADAAEEAPGPGRGARRWTSPLKPNGGFAILRGNLAPDGLRGEALRPRPHGAQRPGAGVRARGGRLRGRDGEGHPAGRRGRDPQRGARRAAPACARCCT